jgi:predicted DNA-binding transcriptional regulator AlpA
MMKDHLRTDEISNDPATTDPVEPKQRKRAEHHAELLMGLANQKSSGNVDAAEPTEIELWDRAFVQKFFGGSKPLHISTLYRGMADGIYPKPIKASVNSVRWLASECRAALDRMIAERDQPPKRAERRGRPRGSRLERAASEAATAVQLLDKLEAASKAKGKTVTETETT